MSPSPRQRCPCHSGRTYGACCRPFLVGGELPAPEALMRSRYSAYALGKVAYIQETTAPAARPASARWAEEIRAFGRHVEFAGLEILAVEEAGDEAWVTFRADLRQDGEDIGYTERSRFVREGRWRYAGGERLAG